MFSLPLFFLFSIVFFFSFVLCGYDGDDLPTAQWKNVNDGLPGDWKEFKCFWEFNGKIYLALEKNWDSQDAGTFRFSTVSGARKWRQVSSYAFCPHCDNGLCYDGDSASRPISFNPDNWLENSKTASVNILSEKRGKLTQAVWVGDPRLISLGSFQLKLRDGGSNVFGYRENFYSIGSDSGMVSNQLLEFNITEKEFYVRNAAFIDSSAAGGQWTAALRDGSVVFVAAYGRQVWRFSRDLQRWHNMTYDLDQRNMLYQQGGGSKNLATDDERKELYISTEMGVFWFRGNQWRRLLANWGNSQVVVHGKYLFSQGSRWNLPGATGAMKLSKFPGYPFPNRNQSNVDFFGPFSPDGGKTIFAIPFWNSNEIAEDARIPMFQSNRGWHFGVHQLKFPEFSDPIAKQTSVSNNFVLSHGGFLGGPGNDKPIGSQLFLYQTYQTAVVGMNFGVLPANIQCDDISSLGYGNSQSRGFLLIISVKSQGIYKAGQIIRAFSVGGQLIAMKTNKITAVLIISTSEGITAFDKDFNILWSFNVLPGQQFYRLAIAESGMVGALSLLNGRNNVTLIQNGQLFATRDRTVFAGVATEGVSDIAISSKFNLVYTVGFSQIAVGALKGLQRGNLFAYSIRPENSLQEVWSVWSKFSEKALRDANLLSDTRIHRINLGADDSLAVLGQSAGGNTIFASTDGQTIGGSAKLVSLSDATDAFNTRDAHLLYIGKLDAATGVLLRGQWRIPRANGIGNTFSSNRAAIAMRNDGEVNVVGVSACCIPGRDGSRANLDTVQRVNCKRASFYNGDTVVLGVSGDFKTTRYWTTLNAGTKAAGNGIDVDFDETYGVAVFEATNATTAVTDGSSCVNDDAYFIIFPVDQTQDPSTCDAEVLASSPPFAPIDSSYLAFVQQNPSTDITNLGSQKSGSAPGARGNFVALIFAILSIMAAWAL